VTGFGLESSVTLAGRCGDLDPFGNSTIVAAPWPVREPSTEATLDARWRGSDILTLGDGSQFMPNSFARTTRSLRSDSFGRSLTFLSLAAALLSLWVAWFFLGQVRLYATSETARLEVESQVHPLQAGVAGTVVRAGLALGGQVTAGETLVELDATGLRLKLAQERLHLGALSAQLELLQRELETEQLVLEGEQTTNEMALAEARARQKEAEARATFALEKAKRWKNLASDGVVSGVDRLEAEAQSKQREESLHALFLGARRLRQEGRTRTTSQRAFIERLEREQARLSGEVATRRASVQWLENEIERHLIRAPVAGRLGEVASLRVGSVVEAGQRVGAVVPDGIIRAVAFFSPAEAAGRLRPRQRARLRLDGFPWTQYGSLSAQVTGVGSEPQGGMVRVELELREEAEPARIPLEHGLPGAAEVEVEQVSPAVLALRAAGRLVQQVPRSPGAGQELPKPRGKQR